MQHGAYDWSRWTAQNWQIPITAVVLYVVVLVALSVWMRGREPIIMPRVSA